MADKKQDFIDQKSQDLDDGVDRRVLKCMAWGRYRAQLVWTMSGGIPVSRAFAKDSTKDTGKGADFSSEQISESHIGCNKPASPSKIGY